MRPRPSAVRRRSVSRRSEAPPASLQGVTRPIIRVYKREKLSPGKPSAFALEGRPRLSSKASQGQNKRDGLFGIRRPRKG